MTQMNQTVQNSTLDGTQMRSALDQNPIDAVSPAVFASLQEKGHTSQMNTAGITMTGTNTVESPSNSPMKQLEAQ